MKNRMKRIFSVVMTVLIVIAIFLFSLRLRNVDPTVGG